MTTEVAVIEKQNAVVAGALAMFNATDAGLAELKGRLASKVYGDITTTAVYKEISADRTECMKVWTDTEKLRKEVKAPYIEAGKKIDAEAGRITVEAKALHAPIQALIDAEDARKEAIKAEKAAADALRISTIRNSIAGFAGFIRMAADYNSEEMTMHIAKIEAGHLVATDYAELLPEAEAARVDVLVKLKLQLAGLVEKEAEAVKAAAEKAEKDAAELAERERIKAEQDAEATRLEAVRIENEKTAAIEREKIAVEQAALAEQRAELEKFYADKAAAQKVIDDAAAVELMAQQAIIDKERATLQAEQDRLVAIQKEKDDAAALELTEMNRKAKEKADAATEKANKKNLADAQAEYSAKMEAATEDHLTTLESILSATIDDTLSAPAALQLIGHLAKLAIEKESAA